MKEFTTKSLFEAVHTKKKSLNVMARTMIVIPEDERNDYWGMYDNVCFWRCVSYLMDNDITEACAASWAYDWFVSEYGLISADYYLSTYNDSGIARSEMRKFLRANDMMVGDNANNQIVGLLHTSDLDYYKNNPNIPAYGNHNIILEYVNPDGSCQMYDPQHNVRFTASASERERYFVPINYGNID